MRGTICLRGGFRRKAPDVQNSCTNHPAAPGLFENWRKMTGEHGIKRLNFQWCGFVKRNGGESRLIDCCIMTATSRHYMYFNEMGAILPCNTVMWALLRRLERRIRSYHDAMIRNFRDPKKESCQGTKAGKVAVQERVTGVGGGFCCIDGNI